MKELSIILRVKNEKLKTTVEALAPLFKKFTVELIILAEQKSVPAISQPYTLYPPIENCLKFSDFCMETAVAEKVLVIDGDIAVSSELADRLIGALEDSRFQDISCCMKSYLSEDKTSFFEHEEVLIYNQLTRGFHKNCGEIVEDYSFLDRTKDGLVSGIIKLCGSGRYRELADWYQNFILVQPEEIQNQFCMALEKYKELHMEDWDAKELDDKFAGHCLKNEYGEYLRSKKELFHQKVGLPSAMKSGKAPIYYSWLLRRFLKTNQPCSSLSECGESVLRSELQYLLNEDDSAPDYLVRYLETNWDSMSKNKIFRCFPEIYISNMQNRSKSVKDKKRLMRICDRYLETIAAEPTSVGSFVRRGTDLGCFHEMMEAQKLEVLGQIEAAAHRLDRACSRFPENERILRYYMQRMRNSSQSYPYLLSVCMIVKDEEKNLERCLKSLSPLITSGMAELIVVDTGSQDRTMEIAAEYTDKLYNFPWDGSFSEARNASVLHADGEYIMIMDADEEISPSELEKLQDVFLSCDYKQSLTYVIRLKSYTDASLVRYTTMAQPRIFRNNGEFYYSSSVHNQPVCSPPIKALDVEICHYGYIMTEDIREKKFLRTSTLLKKELEKNPKNLYYRFQMSTSYAMYGDIKKALEQVEIYMRQIDAQTQLNDTVLMYYNNAAIINLDCHRYDECDRICKKGLRIRPDYIDLLYCEAGLHFVREEYKESLSYAADYLKLADTFQKNEIARDGRFAFYSICNREEVKELFLVASYRLKHFDDVISMASRLTNNKLLKNSLHEIVDAYLGSGRFSDLSEFYQSQIEMNEDPDTGLLFRQFLIARLSEQPEEFQRKCLSEFGPDFRARYIPTDLAASDYQLFSPDLIDRYDFDEVDYESLYPFLTDAVPTVLAFSVKECGNPAQLNHMKKLAAIILHRTKEILLSCLSAKDLVRIYDKYMEISSKLINLGQMDLLSPCEKIFIAKMLAILNKLKAGDAKAAAELMEDISLYDYKMHDFIEFARKALIPRAGKTADGGSVKSDPESKASVYGRDLKTEIQKLQGSDSPKKILGLFAAYHREEFYDAELFSILINALMACDRRDDAQTAMASALKKFPDDSGLQKTLLYLSLLEHDRVGAEQAYCRMRIGNPGDQKTQLLLPLIKQLPDAGEKKLRVLQGTMDFTPRIRGLSEALRRRGIFSRSLNYAPVNAETRSDYELAVNRMKKGNEIVNATSEAAGRLISQFDVFHFHYGYTLTFDRNDLPALKDLGKKVFMQYWGQEVRLKSKGLSMCPEYMAGTDYDEKIMRRLESVSAFIPHCIVCDEEIYEYVKDFFEDVHIIRPMIDLKRYRPLNRTRRKNTFVIVHAISPNKGSKEISRAVEALQNDYSIDYKMIRGIPHEKAMEIYQDADLIIDQILSGSYGKLAIEAMALGKPVICGISDFMREKYPAELPVLSARPDSIKQTIEFVLKNREMLPELGKKGRAYVEKYHDANQIVGELIHLYQS